MFLYYFLIALYLLVCLLLLLVVLLQQGKGGDMASAFGGGGSSQTAFGARAGATVLTRATTILGALFMLGAILLGVYGQRGPGSVLSGYKTTAPQSAPAPATPAPGPATPAPAPTPEKK
jgi:preprotein translocase subunit SecG